MTASQSTQRIIERHRSSEVSELSTGDGDDSVEVSARIKRHLPSSQVSTGAATGMTAVADSQVSTGAGDDNSEEL